MTHSAWTQGQGSLRASTALRPRGCYQTEDSVHCVGMLRCSVCICVIVYVNLRAYRRAAWIPKCSSLSVRAPHRSCRHSPHCPGSDGPFSLQAGGAPDDVVAPYVLVLSTAQRGEVRSTSPSPTVLSGLPVETKPPPGLDGGTRRTYPSTPLSGDLRPAGPREATPDAQCRDSKSARCRSIDDRQGRLQYGRSLPRANQDGK